MKKSIITLTTLMVLILVLVSCSSENMVEPKFKSKEIASTNQISVDKEFVDIRIVEGPVYTTSVQYMFTPFALNAIIIKDTGNLEPHSIEWSSDNNFVASIHSTSTLDPKRCYIQANNAGEAYIYVKYRTKYATYTAKCKVIVKATVYPNDLVLDNSFLNFYLRDPFTPDSKKLNATILPEYATELPDVEWESSDPSIASVDEEGNVTAHRYGVAYITAKIYVPMEFIKAKCKVTVKDLPVIDL